MKKQIQLGMNPGTASHRLVKDILWTLIVRCGMDSCHACGKKISRDTLSIEHVIPWLDSDDPVGLFFDQRNIAFSHLSCNAAAARKVNKKYLTPEDARQAELKRSREYRRRTYTPAARSERYGREGR